MSICLTDNVDTSTWTTDPSFRTLRNMIEQLRGYCETALTSPTIVTLGVLVASFAIARVLARILRVVLVRMTRKTRNGWDDRLADTLAGPLSTCVVLIAFTWLLPWLPVATSAVGV